MGNILFERWILVGVISFFLFLCVVDLFSYFYNKKQEEISIGIVGNELGLLFAITGKIRAGKTSLGVAITHFFTRIFGGKASGVIQETQVVLNEIDFNELDEDIYNLYEQHYDHLEIYDKLYNKYSMLIQGQLKNGLENVNKDLYFKKYINARCSLFDNNFVLANIKIRSRITDTVSSDFLMSDMKLKLINENPDTSAYKFREYKVYLNDEGANTDESHEHAKIAKEDEGIAAAMRLWGQINRENSAFILVMQNLGRKVLEQRELITALLNVQKLDIKEYRSLRFIVNLLRGVFSILYSTVYFVLHPFPRKRIQAKNRPNIFKKFDYIFYYLQKRIFALSYLKWSVRIYFKAEDENKENTSSNVYYYPVNLVARTKYAFGTYDTHFYAFIDEILRRKCFLTYKDIKQGIASIYEDDLPKELQDFQDDTMNEVLTRRNAAKETPEVTSRVEIMDLKKIEL